VVPGGLLARRAYRCNAALMLDKYPQNRGVGLDFVPKREYGRSRWLDYPAEKN
jgi:hypothetical protein